MSLDLVGRLQAVSLQPGDTLVLMCDRPISADICERLRVDLKSRFPDHKCLVLDDGLQIGVLSQDDRLASVERKLDVLIASLANDGEEDAPALSLDGQAAGAERDASHSLE